MVSFPDQVRQGDTVIWRTGAGLTPVGDEISSSSGWSLVTYVRFPVATGATQANGVAYEDGWQSSITASVTSLFPVGQRGAWQEQASKAGEVYTLGSGSFDVIASLSTAGAVDGRSVARRDLELCQAAIRDILTKGGMQEYTIGTRTKKLYRLSELMELENKLKADVIREEAGESIRNGRGNPYNVYVRF